MRARLLIQEGESTPRELYLDPQQITTLGRSRDNTVLLPSEHVSRRQAHILFQDGQWLLIGNTEATNPTCVNEQVVSQPWHLEDNQVITIADIRLHFFAEKTAAPAPAVAPSPLPPPPPPSNLAPAPEEMRAHTPLWLDELSCLHNFMTRTVAETDPLLVIGQALEIAGRQTQATIAGYLNLDPDNVFTKIVWPTTGQVDRALSKRLTELVQKNGQMVWLQGIPQNQEESQSDSLAPFSDAMCVPLKVEAEMVGALHVYKDSRLFTPRDVRFCEILAGYSAGTLARLRLCNRLEAENVRLRNGVPLVEEIVGQSPVMLQLRQRIARVAPTTATVLIQGESGAGKELVAFALHRQSPRRRQPFVVVNCGALAESLIDSQLFGHSKGAFTGAQTTQLGIFQQADDGTLFLDEIGELTPEAQVKLLRVIEGKPFRPLGGTRDVRTDVRVVAATHKDLQREVSEGRFRDDLFFRLQDVVIQVPALRDHAEDIPQLAEYLLAKLPLGKGRKLTGAAIRRLQEFPWPGNVRQMRSVLKNATIMTDGDTIDARDLFLPESPSLDQPGTLKLAAWEVWAINKALAISKGNITKAAEVLDISRETLGNKLKIYKLGKYAVD